MKTESAPEKKAPELHIPWSERLKSIPEVFGIRFNEEPAYEVLKSDGDFEVRRYSERLLAKVTLQGMPFDAFREAAFNKLASFIFGGNEQEVDVAMTLPVLEAPAQQGKRHLEIAMTSPVLETQTGAQEWTMSFILPAKYTLQTAPKPLDSDIQFEEVPGHDVASVRYTGNNSLEKINEHEKKLNEWLAAQTQYKKAGKFFAAQYDAPFVLPFLKRNEVQVKVISAN